MWFLDAMQTFWCAWDHLGSKCQGVANEAVQRTLSGAVRPPGAVFWHPLELLRPYAKAICEEFWVAGEAPAPENAFRGLKM